MNVNAQALRLPAVCVAAFTLIAASLWPFGVHAQGRNIIRDAEIESGFWRPVDRAGLKGEFRFGLAPRRRTEHLDLAASGDQHTVRLRSFAEGDLPLDSVHEGLDRTGQQHQDARVGDDERPLPPPPGKAD